MKFLLPIILFTLIVNLSAYSQSMLSLEFLKDTTAKGKQYIQLIFHADSLYKARNYEKAVAAYDEAFQLKQKEQYPRFKAEDIRTLYLKNDIAKAEQKQGEPTEYAWSKRHREKEEREEREKHPEKKIEEPAKQKENPVITANEKKEIKSQHIEQPIKKEQPLAENPKELTDEKKIINPQIDEQTKKDADEKLKAYEKLKVQEKAEEKQKIEDREIAKKEIENKTIIIENTKKEKEINTISDIIIQKSKNEEQKRITADASFDQDAKPEDEQKILAAKYPKEKTIETIKEATKTITQIIINQNGMVTIYLKVAHNWGQTFYFIKEPTSQMKSISRDYFERYTR